MCEDYQSYEDSSSVEHDCTKFHGPADHVASLTENSLATPKLGKNTQNTGLTLRNNTVNK